MNKTIIYINYVPYENAGNILDYLKAHFSTIVLFSFNFHHLGKNQKSNSITVFRNKKIIQRYSLFHVPTPERIAFILLPLRSMALFMQLLFYIWKLSRIYGVFDIFFTVNAFIAWTGIIVKKLGMVKKTVFWIWDYYPPIHKNWIVMLMRWLYWQFDKPATLGTDRIIFMNKRLEELRKDIGILPKHSSFPIVSIGTNPIYKIRKTPSRELRIAFLGVLKISQGLDLFFNSAQRLQALYPNISLSIVGGGPDEDYFKKRALETNIPVKFHGYVPQEQKINRILSLCHIGIAPYIPEESNVSYFTDPSKIKKYLSLSLPVITTDVFDFSSEIRTKGAGYVIAYNQGSFISAVTKIMNHYRRYQKNAYRLGTKFNYKKNYAKLFS